MVYIELNDVAAALLPAVRQLQGTVAERMHITGDGAYSIKTNARTFFRDAFGRTAVCKNTWCAQYILARHSAMTDQ